MSSKKSNGFICGVLTVNGGVQHSILDVETRKKLINGSTVVLLYSSDFPPIPILSDTDELDLTFQFENCSNLSEPSCAVIVQENFKADRIDPSERGGQCAIPTEHGEWQFMRNSYQNEMIGPWYLAEIQLRVTEARIRQCLSV